MPDHSESRSRRKPLAEKQAELALVVLAQVAEAVAHGIPADAALNDIYHKHREYGSRDRRFFSNLAFSHLRWRGWTEALAVRRMREASLICALLDADEISPALSALAVGTAWEKTCLLPLGPLPLHEKAVHLAGLLAAAPPSLTSLAPDWLPRVLHTPEGTDPGDHLRRCVEAFQRRPPTWVRACRHAAQDVEKVLREAGAEPRRHARIAQAIAIGESGLPPFNAVLLKLKGRVEIQDLASQAVGLICAPGEDSIWWDACAGALGKSLHLADIMRGKGRILATDIRESVLENGRRRAIQAGVRCIKTRRWDGESDPAPGEKFDGVLVDAPCSCLGVWHRNPDARWRTRPEEVSEHAALQERLLGRAADKLRPGGALVYSTCTLTGAENEGVIRAFLQSHPGFEPDPFPHPLSGEQTDGTVWIWPWDGPCNGMFAARMRKPQRMLSSTIIARNPTIGPAPSFLPATA